MAFQLSCHPSRFWGKSTDKILDYNELVPLITVHLRQEHMNVIHTLRPKWFWFFDIFRSLPKTLRPKPSQSCERTHVRQISIHKPWRKNNQNIRIEIHIPLVYYPLKNSFFFPNLDRHHWKILAEVSPLQDSIFSIIRKGFRTNQQSARNPWLQKSQENDDAPLSARRARKRLGVVVVVVLLMEKIWAPKI